MRRFAALIVELFILGAAVACWLKRRIQDRNKDFEREFGSRWWILFRKFEIPSKSCTITAVIIYRCYPVTPSRQQPKYESGASGPLAICTNLKKQVRIHESTVACDWAGAVMPENHEKNKI